MNKYFLPILCIILSIMLSACNAHPKASMIKAERRLEKYFQDNSSKPAGVVDLSEGPKLRYDANFGPTNPNFDFKIVNPY